LETPGDAAERLVTRSEIARRAMVSRPTVTTWAKRHRDFPKPVNSGDADYFSLASVISWLDQRQIPAKDLLPGEVPGLTYGQRVRRNWSVTSERSEARPPAPQGHDVAHALDQLLGSAAAAVRKGGGSQADYLMLLICLVFLRNCADSEWRTIRETALRQDGTDPGGLMQLIAGLTDRALRARGILPGVQSVLERLKPRSSTDLTTVIILCDDLGPDAMDSLFTRFSMAAQLAEASYFTPAPVARLMATLAAKDNTTRYSVYDPYVRGGELGTAVSDLPGTSSLTVRGESPDPQALRMAGMKLAVHGIPAQLGSTYGGPPPGPHARNAGFNVVLTNPPFNSPYLPGGGADQRWIFGPPPPSNANYAWLQIAISSLAPGGAASVLMPLQATVTSDEREHLIRSQMVERDTVAAIISLPPRMFSAANVAATLWLLRSPTDMPESVLFVDARNMTLQDAGHAIPKALDREELHADGHIKELQGGGLAARVSIDTIRLRNYSLNPADYMGAAIAPAPGHAMEAAKHLRDLERLRARLTRLDAHVTKLQLLQRTGYDGDLPPGWKLLPLTDVCDIQPGPSYSRLRAHEKAENASVPVIASRHLRGGRVVASRTKQVAEDLAQRLAKFRLTVNDILCVRSGTMTAPALVEAEQEGWLFDTNLLRLRVKTGVIDPRFLLGFLSLPSVLDWIRNRSTGSAIAFITAENLGELEVPIPPLAEQQAIASALQIFDELIAAHEYFAYAALDARTAISAQLIHGGLTLR
jgi:type I restriction enzyme M protein